MKINKIFFAVSLLTLFLVAVFPTEVLAQAGEVNKGLQRVGSEIGASGGTGLFRPGDSVVVVIGKIIRILLMISGAVAVLFVVIGGFMYLTSAGNEEQAGKGRQTIVYALIGLVLMILAYVIVNVVVSLVEGRGFSFFGF